MSDYIPKIMKGGAELTSPSLIASVILTNNTINQQEATRQSHEADREFAETQRDSAESARASDELTRESNEETRVADETTRQDYYNAYKVLVNYNSSTAYIVGNKVTYQGGTYQCITNTTGNSPTYNTDNTWWKCIAAKGTDGAGGDMFKSTYDPNNKNTDAFNSENQVYDNTTSGLSATNAQAAIDELKSQIGDLGDLDTTSKSDLVGAVNENKVNIDTKVSKGDLSLNVKDYGAIGNGMADDTLSIQNTFSVISALGGGTVEFPHGNYKYSASITVPENTTIHFNNCIFTAIEAQPLFYSSSNDICFYGSAKFIGVTGSKFVLLNQTDRFHCNMSLNVSGLSTDGMAFNAYRANNIIIEGQYTTNDSPIVVFNGCSNVEISGLQCYYSTDIPYNTTINLLDNDDTHTFNNINIHDCYIDGGGVLSRGFINITRVDVAATDNIQPSGNNYIPINNVDIHNCTCINSVSIADGIDVLFCTNARINNNFVSNVFEGIAILASGVTCSDNNITTTRSCGIAIGDLNIGSSGTNFSSILINNNTILGCGDGTGEWILPAAIACKQPATCFASSIYINNNILSKSGTYLTDYAFYLGANTSGGNIVLSNNFMYGNIAAVYSEASAGQVKYFNNPGYNPTGVITPPAISTTPVTNTYGVPMRVIITNGSTAQGVKLNSVIMNSTPAYGSICVIVSPDETICMQTSTTGAAWAWAGL